jgi:hypothetical protein
MRRGGVRLNHDPLEGQRTVGSALLCVGRVCVQSKVNNAFYTESGGQCGQEEGKPCRRTQIKTKVKTAYIYGALAMCQAWL